MKNLSSEVRLSKFDLDAITSLLTSEDGNPALNKLAAEMEPDETKRQLQGMEQQMRYQGIDLEAYAKYIGKTVDELKAEIKVQATRNVKARLVLEKLIKTENLDITEKDIDTKIEEMAKNVGKTVEEYKKQVNDSMVNHIANDLLMKKIVDFLHANNEIK